MIRLVALIQSYAATADERGAGMAEYALLLALVAVALIAGFQGLATAIGGAVTNAANSF